VRYYLDQVGTTHYFRRVVPIELRPYLLTATGKPRAEFKISLRTKDLETAKREVHAHLVATDEAFEAARQQIAQTALTQARL
jgi:hypothetical protein